MAFIGLPVMAQEDWPPGAPATTRPLIGMRE